MDNGVLKALVDDLLRGMNKMYASMPIGSFLCVHEDREIATTVEEIGTVFSIVQDVHVIRTPEECEYRVRKTQYGPKE